MSKNMTSISFSLRILLASIALLQSAVISKSSYSWRYVSIISCAKGSSSTMIVFIMVFVFTVPVRPGRSERLILLIEFFDHEGYPKDIDGLLNIQFVFPGVK